MSERTSVTRHLNDFDAHELSACSSEVNVASRNFIAQVEELRVMNRTSMTVDSIPVFVPPNILFLCPEKFHLLVEHGSSEVIAV